MKGPFSWWYAISGVKPGDPNSDPKEEFNKALGILIKQVEIILVIAILIVGLVASGSWIWRILHPKPKVVANTATTTIAGPKDSATQNIKYTVVQIGEKSKPPIRVVPYIDANTGYGNGRDRYFSSEYGWEVKAGLRLEFDGLFDGLFGGKKSTTQQVQTAITAAESIKDPQKDIAETSSAINSKIKETGK